MNHKQIEAHVLQTGQSNAILTDKRDGLTLLYKAACLENDIAQMDNLRAQIESIQSQILDNYATQGMFLRQGWANPRSY